MRVARSAGRSSLRTFASWPAIAVDLRRNTDSPSRTFDQTKACDENSAQAIAALYILGCRIVCYCNYVGQAGSAG
jgi:hypothetical protein